ncbi:glucose-6-phosphate isomerase [Fulvimonas soli]|jgi:glucose-6-phosphate isomerase|uniref:Glucose-6-phosphate isomerase n=1 Tax=Fulvimonas soli TaxID=155197 RepID=A0A316IGY1_9GAMM|nr:glucose-6-phosphate isomerase [Fulvimonas soli]PWK92802.1 glucose-6-phosphate isomerase [Fulvimonas soli]TNY28075.1 glucose-6-phosphate isomerase [Fulvimonas soli]
MTADPRSLFADHAQRLAGTTLRELLADPSRNARLRQRLGPILLDLGRQKLDLAALDALGAHVEAGDWQRARDAMFAGAPINASEQRAVLHTALRAEGSSLPSPAPAEVLHEIGEVLARMEELANALGQGEGGRLGLADGITDVVNIGIGGSDLGPRLAVRALTPFHAGRLRSHFLTNVDGQAAYELMRALDPKRTLVVMVSKTFTTQETLLNGNVLREWVAAAYAGDERQAVARHFVAVSANVGAAAAWGIPAAHVYPMWDFVGGRFSLWSAVGLSLALAVGMDHFRAMLAGAAQVDDHFRTAPWQRNLPVLLALVEFWNRNVQGRASRAVVPYADLLSDLTAYLQQLEMESLGKRVTPQGEPVAQATVPVVWGSVGTNAQHAYFQALHQGTDVVPLEFIGVARPAHPLRANHDALLSNLLAQAAALALGKTFEEALAESGGDPVLAAQRTFPGDRPSTVILLDALTPASFGALVALYEHKVFMLGHLWGINAFDQWGVELGKSIARQILPALADGDAAALDPATRALVAEIRERREVAG